MANYETLKSAIQDVVKTNGNNEITGALLQQSLLAMINSLGVGYQFLGVATPSTNPGTIDQRIFYIASQNGTYVNFNEITISNEIAILYFDTTWHKSSIYGTMSVFANGVRGIKELYLLNDTVKKVYFIRKNYNGQWSIAFADNDNQVIALAGVFNSEDAANGILEIRMQSSPYQVIGYIIMDWWSISEGNNIVNANVNDISLSISFSPVINNYLSIGEKITLSHDKNIVVSTAGNFFYNERVNIPKNGKVIIEIYGNGGLSNFKYYLNGSTTANIITGQTTEFTANEDISLITIDYSGSWVNVGGVMTCKLEYSSGIKGGILELGNAVKLLTENIGQSGVIEQQKNITKGAAGYIIRNTAVNIKKGDFVYIRISPNCPLTAFRYYINNTSTAHVITSMLTSFIADEDINLLTVDYTASWAKLTGDVTLYVGYGNKIKGDIIKLGAEISETNSFDKYENAPIFSWIDDDMEENGITGIVKPVSTALSIKPSIAVIPSFESLTQNVSFTNEQKMMIQELQELGYSILMHPYHNLWYGSGRGTYADIEKNLVRTIQLFSDGLCVNSNKFLVYPGSSSRDATIRAIVKRWCDCGISSSIIEGGIYHGNSFKLENLGRLFIDFTVTTKTQIKAQIMNAAANGSWLILGTHSWQFSNSDVLDESSNTKANLQDVLDYAKGLGVFMPVQEAYRNRIFSIQKANK